MKVCGISKRLSEAAKQLYPKGKEDACALNSRDHARAFAVSPSHPPTAISASHPTGIFFGGFFNMSNRDMQMDKELKKRLEVSR